MKITDFKTGDLILFHTQLKWYSPMSWLSVAIRFFTKSYYNHIGVVVVNWGVPFLNEAIETGIITIPLTERLDGRAIRVIRPKKAIDEKSFAVKANSKLGHTGYDFSGLIIYQLIFQMTGHWLGHTDAGGADKRMYCGEYAAWNYPKYFPKWWQTAPSEEDKSKDFNTQFEGIFKNY